MNLLFLLITSCSSIQSVAVPTLGIGSTMVSDKDSMTLLFIPAGEFTMGSDIGDNEKPIHKVYLDGFWIDQTEVTNKMYELCQSAGVCLTPIRPSSETRSDYYGNPQFENYPVIYVTWSMAKTYCEWANRRLPTEAEWEKSARGIDERIYPWGNEIDKTFANYNSYVGDTTAVGSYESGKSPYGAYDMAGNVWEWTSSLHQPYPYDATDGREDLSSSGSRVLRGGSWHLNHWLVRSAIRLGLERMSFTDNDFGFRCTMDATP
jgi:formylglycine-generating enzyme required for sulfatase activity